MRSAIQVAAAVLLLLSLGLFGCGGDATSAGDTPGTGSGTPGEVNQPVTLLIEFDDGTTRRFEAIAWADGMTVQSVLDTAEDADGPLVYRHSGRGETAILHAIDGVENEGAGHTANNWLYWVNDEFATRGFGVAQVEPGDTVTWRFAPYDSAE